MSDLVNWRWWGYPELGMEWDFNFPLFLFPLSFSFSISFHLVRGFSMGFAVVLWSVRKRV